MSFLRSEKRKERGNKFIQVILLSKQQHPPYHTTFHKALLAKSTVRLIRFIPFTVVACIISQTFLAAILSLLWSAHRG